MVRRSPVRSSTLHAPGKRRYRRLRNRALTACTCGVSRTLASAQWDLLLSDGRALHARARRSWCGCNGRALTAAKCPLVSNSRRRLSAHLTEARPGDLENHAGDQHWSSDPHDGSRRSTGIVTDQRPCSSAGQEQGLIVASCDRTQVRLGDGTEQGKGAPSRALAPPLLDPLDHTVFQRDTSGCDASSHARREGPRRPHRCWLDDPFQARPGGFQLSGRRRSRFFCHDVQSRDEAIIDNKAINTAPVAAAINIALTGSASV